MSEPKKKSPQKTNRRRRAGGGVLATLERPAGRRSARAYKLCLYISGSSPRSVEAIAAVHSVCNEYLEGRCELEVVDIYQQPLRAVDSQIVAAPTLVKIQPLPVKKLIGNLSDRPRLLSALGLCAISNHGHPA